MKTFKLHLLTVLIVLVISIYSLSKLLFNWFSNLLALFVIVCLNSIETGNNVQSLEEYIADI